MLQLVLGIAGAGKTAALYEAMRARAAEGEASVLLVPEQYSSSAEAAVYHGLGEYGAGFVEVVSFRTLAERIFKACGAPAMPVLSDAGRVVQVRRALDAVAGEMKTYARHRRSAAFCHSCAEILNEFKTAGARPEDVRRIGRENKLAKLEELALVFEAYEGVLANTAIDPQDKITRAAERADCGYFTGKAVLVDNFDGFTAPEYAMLAALLPHAQSLRVALCCDGLQETEGGLGRFSPVRVTAMRLMRLAGAAGVKAAPVELLVPPTGENDAAPYALNRFLAWGEAPLPHERRGLWLTNPADEWEEVRLVAAEMRRLAGEGVPYSRMAVICRDVAAYETAVRHEFGLFDIPYHTDAVGTPEYTAPVRFVRAALGLLKTGIASASLVALAKTGLCGYSDEEISALENYVFTWSPRAAEWRAPFEKDPGGLMAAPTKESARQLALAEGLRQKLVPVAERFMQGARGANTAALSKQIYLLLAAFKAPEIVAENAARLEARGEMALAENARRAWDITMGLLDSMVHLLGSERVGADEYDDLFLLLVRGTEFGSVPQTLECAVFTSADRMRLDGPAYCFVLGLAEGEFPMQVGYSGLLTHADRDLLVGGGIQMPGSFEHRTLLEEMFFYRALTSAGEGLYLSWPLRRAGASKAMSSGLQGLQRAFNPPPLAVEPALLAPTPAAAFGRLGTLYRQNSTEAASLYEALREAGGEKQLGLLRAVENSPDFAVRDRETVRSLVGGEMQLSPTRAERYYECGFSYFLERVLRVKPRRKAQLSPMESGTFVHHILEQVLAEAGEGFKSCTDEELAALAQKHADAFLQQMLPANSKREQVLLGQIKAATTRLLCYLRDAAAQSDFAISAVELEIGGEGVPPLELTTPGGETVRVTGKIDRLDTLTVGGKTYLCVIDYKTGTKKFNLEEVYCGLNMQMMIYLHTLCKNASGRYPDAVPAGVLYLAGDPAPSTGARGESAPAYELDGILLDEPAVLRGLDKEGKGVFLPLRHKDGKGLRAGKKLADLEKLGRIGAHVEGLLGDMARRVYEGQFAARPLVKGEKRPCAWCGYRAVCRHEDGRAERPVQAPANLFEEGGLAGGE